MQSFTPIRCTTPSPSPHKFWPGSAQTFIPREVPTSNVASRSCPRQSRLRANKAMLESCRGLRVRGCGSPAGVYPVGWQQTADRAALPPRGSAAGRPIPLPLHPSTPPSLHPSRGRGGARLAAEPGPAAAAGGSPQLPLPAAASAPRPVTRLPPAGGGGCRAVSCGPPAPVRGL